MRRFPGLFRFNQMNKQFLFISLLGVLLFTQSSVAAPPKTDRIRARLMGPVKKVLVEIAQIKVIGGRPIEAPRIPWTSTTYDRNGNRIEEDQLYNSVSLNFKSVFTHDASENLQEGVEYDAGGTVVFKWTYTHTPAENKIEERRSHPNGTLFSTTTYFYDVEGNLIEEKHFPPHTKNHFRWIFRYDKEGRKQEELYYLIRPGERSNQAKEILNFRSDFSYDRQGNLIQEVRRDGAGKLEWDKHYEYQYDNKGNWISQKAFESPNPSDKAPLEPTGMTYRTITYFQE